MSAFPVPVYFCCTISIISSIHSRLSITVKVLIHACLWGNCTSVQHFNSLRWCPVGSIYSFKLRCFGWFGSTHGFLLSFIPLDSPRSHSTPPDSPKHNSLHTNAKVGLIRVFKSHYCWIHYYPDQWLNGWSQWLVVWNQVKWWVKAASSCHFKYALSPSCCHNVFMLWLQVLARYLECHSRNVSTLKSGGLYYRNHLSGIGTLHILSSASLQPSCI